MTLCRPTWRTLATIGVLVLGACRGLPDPVYREERPAGSDAWVEVAGPPAWITAPPARDGALVLVATGRSNARGIVTHGNGPLPRRVIERNAAAALAPLVGAGDAARIAAGLPDRMVLLERACKEELLTRDMVPGNTLCTAWALFALPLDAATADVPADLRPEAQRALAACDLVGAREPPDR